MAEDNQNAEMENETQNPTDSGERVDPILAHLSIDDADVDKTRIRETFIKMWEYEDGDNLKPDEQFLTTVAVFMYVTHNIMDDYNIRADKVRNAIVAALKAWKFPDVEQVAEKERAADNPFRAFVDGRRPHIEEIYTWENFLLDEKACDDKQWTYKMNKCWFAQFFIRLGRVDLIETACNYDKIPWEARQDFVDLKLNNMFQKLGSLCQFKYTPAKK